MSRHGDSYSWIDNFFRYNSEEKKQKIPDSEIEAKQY